MKIRDSTIIPRLLSINQLSQYTSLCQKRAIDLGDMAGARRKFGKRVLYDRELVDKYIETLPEG